MPLFHHPFASTEYARWSRSTDTLARWLRHDQEDEPVPPVPALPPAFQTPEPDVAVAQPVNERPSTAPPPRVDVDVPARSSKSSPGHFVKHSSSVTVLLSGQEHRRKGLEYTNGDVIDGILAVPRPCGLLSLEIMVEGVVKLNEIAGHGSTRTDILKDSLFLWEADRHASFPTKVTFRYPLPSHYTHLPSGEPFRLPSSYESHLHGMPGFRVEVAYAIVIYIARNRKRTDWWRRNSRLTVPFNYFERSHPSLAGPFPCSSVVGPGLPKTLFGWLMKSRISPQRSIKVRLYLPSSQVCCLSLPIPFYVTLVGDEDDLAPFSGYRPSVGSFHPLSSPNTSSGSLPQQLIARTAYMTPPIDIHLYRRTDVDVLGATESNVHPKTHLSTTRNIAKSVIQGSSRQAGSITWSGIISVSPRIRCGGFDAKGIKVSDFIALHIRSPNGARSGFADFSENVPIRLTTEPYSGSSAAVTISSDWIV